MNYGGLPAIFAWVPARDDGCRPGDCRADRVPTGSAAARVRTPRRTHSRLPAAAAAINVNCKTECVAGLCIRGLTPWVQALYIAHPANFDFTFFNHEDQPMNRHCIATNASALPGAGAFVRMSVRMTLALGGFTNAGSRCPGEGDAASP